VRLNDMTIQKIPKPQNGWKLYGDDTLPGLGARESFGGSKTFVLTVGTERQRITIGRYPI
jgi:hypothetical protein